MTFSHFTLFVVVVVKLNIEHTVGHRYTLPKKPKKMYLHISGHRYTLPKIQTKMYLHISCQRYTLPKKQTKMYLHISGHRYTVPKKQTKIYLLYIYLVNVCWDGRYIPDMAFHLCKFKLKGQCQEILGHFFWKKNST